MMYGRAVSVMRLITRRIARIGVRFVRMISVIGVRSRTINSDRGGGRALQGRKRALLGLGKGIEFGSMGLFSFLLFLLGNRWLDWSSYFLLYCVIDAYCLPFSSFSLFLFCSFALG